MSPDEMPPMQPDERDAEIEALRLRLAEAEETLRALGSGEVDALVVGDRLFVLDGVEAESNRFRGEVMAQIDDAVIAIDRERRITYFNPAAERQYRTSASRALGRPLDAIYEVRWLAEGDEALVAASLRATGAWRGRSTHVSADGVVLQVESTVSVMRDVEGEATGLLAVVRDVSAKVAAEELYAAQRLEAEQALRDTDRRKDEFLATLAHELRNPLAPINNALRLMELTDSVSVREDGQRIIARQLKQMVHLVDDLLDVSRISQGKVELRLEPVDVVSALQAAVETSRPLIDARRHDLTVRLPASRTLMLLADPTRLCQVVANLLNNAAKYTPDGGHIELIAERDGAEVRITVRDTGMGIPVAMLPRVFDMFAQIDRSLERSQGGLGIGLALVERLVAMHGGSVQALSDGPGEGCTFVVKLPLMPVTAVDALAEPSPLVQGRPGASFGVVIADDNVDNAESLALILDMLGYRTRTAHDGAEALALVMAERPRAVFLDIGMPMMNGLDVARRIRAQPWGSQVLLVAISGWGQDDDRRKTREAGFDRHFVKPVDVEVMATLLSDWPLPPAV